MQLANNYGGEPFDTNVTINLDEINEEDGNSVFRTHNSVDSEQLTSETYNYLQQMFEAAGKELPARDDFPEVTNDTYSASRIHGYTGWLIFSIETKETKAEGVVNIEERIIELK